MRILVTGGAGFIGTWLCDSLVNKGNNVICVDNLITSGRDNAEYLKKKGVEFLRHDVTKKLNLKGSIDRIFHFASPASPKDFSKIPIEIMKANSLGTLKMLNLSKIKGSKFILASTSEVYGNPLKHPQREDYWGNVNPVGPRACYDESKRFSEALTMSFNSQYNVDTVIVRLFNTYGPRMRKDDGRAIPSFISNALKNKPIVIHGNGNQTRSFCYVTDMVEGIERAAFSTHKGVFNLGNPKEMKIIDVAKAILTETKSESKIVYKGMMPDDPIRRKPDIAKAKKMLKWKPKVSFEAGIKETIEWFKEN
jgi:dTDP-glucose 4,6-dehydratase